MNFRQLLINMRKKRELIPGSRYHVIARANRKEMIFISYAQKQMFLDIIKRARKKFRFRLSNFCIMGNHVHLILMPLKGESLSKIMQWVLSVFAMAYNRILNINGHVFYDRFKSIIIYNFRQYVATFVYIMENPMRANIVKNPINYVFNGINFIKMGMYEIIDPPELAIQMVIPGICQFMIS